MNPLSGLRMATAAAAAWITLLTGCSSGPMEITNVHYYAVSHGENTNFYRLTVTANTQFGVAGYREGWFPATAVDKLFGDVSAAGGQSSSAAKEEIRAAYDEAIAKTTKAYLEKAAKPETTEADLKPYWEPRKRVLAFPDSYAPVFGDGAEIAYDVARGVAVPHSDEKLVIVLSSDPDGVIGAITNVAEEEKTAQTINKLGALVNERARIDHATAGARNDVQKQQVAAIRQVLDGINKPADAATGDAAALKSTMANQMLLLRSVLDLAAP